MQEERKVLELLEKDARLTAKELAVMLSKEEGDIRSMIAKMEKDGVLLGYRTIIDWDKTDKEYVSALIELKITPQRDRGFDRVAEKIYNYPEVESLHLMSSANYDLAVFIEGKTLKEVAYFVANKLSTIDEVVATATHFVLRKYQDKGIVYGPAKTDERGNCL